MDNGTTPVAPAPAVQVGTRGGPPPQLPTWGQTVSQRRDQRDVCDVPRAPDPERRSSRLRVPDHASGLSAEDLAELFPVTARWIRSILAREAWGHV